MTQHHPFTATTGDLLRQAIAHHQEGRLPEAETLFRAVLHAEPRNPDAHYNLGLLALRLEKPEAALHHLKTALEIDPNQERFWLSHIEALHRAGQPETARILLTQRRQYATDPVSWDRLAASLHAPPAPLRIEAEQLAVQHTATPEQASPFAFVERWFAGVTVAGTLLPLLFLLASLAAYHLVYARFYTGASVGHDYAGALPMLIENYFWIIRNGLTTPNWFLPGQCGGQPGFAEIQNYFYSVPQFLTLFMPPMRAVYVNLLLSVALGFWGMYLFLARVLTLSIGVAVAGAILFMFNGFYSGRLMAGHYVFHAFMLLPLIAYCLFHHEPGRGWRRELLLALGAGLFLAYWIHGGMAGLLFPSLIILTGLLGLVLTRRPIPLAVCLKRWPLAAFIALSLAAGKMMAGGAYLSHFPRDLYPLPGIASLADLLRIMGRTLFWQHGELKQTIFPYLSHVQWMLDPHIWTHGISLLPLLLILLWIYLRLHPHSFAAAKEGKSGNDRLRRDLGWSLFAVILLLPIVLTWGTAHWQALFKTLPLIKSSSELFRWWAIDMVLVLVVSLMLGNTIAFLNRHQGWYITLAAILAMAWQVGSFDYTYFEHQGYKVAPTNAAWQAAQQPGFTPPPITHTVITATPKGEITMPMERNEFFMRGQSFILCYNAVYGYRMENFPLKTLHPGPVFELENGVYNFKNPACYVFPEENQCAPGDHFTAAQKADLEALVNYRPFRYEIPTKQKIANALGALVALAVPILLWVALFTGRRPATGSETGH
ncbi:MAG: tetratricopeptide repeat protein [Magnetococcales bacterium]|nr:tetratricopeptide repeat protein [Magnetococcales bacterium]